MKKIITRIAQSYADLIIAKMQNSESDSEFQMWYTQGINLNTWCILRDIELQ